MIVGVVSTIRSSTLHRSYRTPEDRPGEVLYLVHDAACVSLSVESEGKQTGGLYAVSQVRKTVIISPADLCSDLSDVSIASLTGIRVSRWCVVHVVLSCYPGQIARELSVDRRVGGLLVQCRPNIV